MLHSRFLPLLTLLLAATLPCARAASPEQEKAFVASFRQALETHNAQALSGFLSTEGAEPGAVAMFKMMLDSDPTATVVSVDLSPATAEQMASYREPRPMPPSGREYILPLKPVRQLTIRLARQSDSGSASSSMSCPVAEKAGKLVIPVPVPAPARAKK